MKAFPASLIFASLSILVSAMPAAESGPGNDTEVVRLTPEKIEEVLATVKKYEFTLAADGRVVAANGESVRERDLIRFLKKMKADKEAYFVVRVDPAKNEIERAKKVAGLFGDYGATRVVVTKIMTPEREVASSASAGTEGTSKPKVLVLQGGTNPASTDARTRRPDLNGRPERLRPEPLPPRVRYVFKSDVEMMRADELISKRLVSAEVSGEVALFGDLVLIQQGAWSWLKESPHLGKKDSTPMNGLVPIGGKTHNFEGRMLRNHEEIMALEKMLRDLIAADGGGTVRAMRALEMDRWWTFIGFDIEEPTLVVESKGGKYRFVLGFGEGGVFVLDELNALPDIR